MSATRRSRRSPRRPSQRSTAAGRNATQKARGRVFVVSSPSGGGKTTVVQQVRQRLPWLARSVSVTTRAPRPGEQDGRDYQFISQSRFLSLKRTGQLLEWARVHGAYYGTPKRPVLRALAQGRSLVLSIDVQGAKQVRRALGKQTVLIFLFPPSMAQLRRRLEQRRTETLAAIRQRLIAATRELACAPWYDYTVINDRLSQTVRRVQTIMVRAHRGMRRQTRDGKHNERGSDGASPN